MTREEIIKALKEEAKANPVFNAVCHQFALRERTRFTINLNTLYYTLQRENFSFTKEQLSKVLEKLAALGLGELERGSNGSIRALKRIQMTLQSIGEAACTQGTQLMPGHPRRRFRTLIGEVISPPKTNENDVEAGVMVVVKGDTKTIKIDLPPGMTKKQLDEVTALVDKLLSA